MTNKRLLACAGAVLSAIFLTAAAASAQAVTVNSPAMRAGHIGTPLYMRIPVGSRAESAALKADQDAMMSAQQSQTQMQKVRKKR